MRTWKFEGVKEETEMMEGSRVHLQIETEKRIFFEGVKEETEMMEGSGVQYRIKRGY